MLPIANFPQCIYQTRHHFNDSSTDGMNYGDLSETQLKHQFGLDIISNTVDPWNLRRLTPSPVRSRALRAVESMNRVIF